MILSGAGYEHDPRDSVAVIRRTLVGATVGLLWVVSAGVFADREFRVGL